MSDQREPHPSLQPIDIWANKQPCPKCGVQMEQKKYSGGGFDRYETTVDRDGACGSVELWQCPTCKNVEWGLWS